MIRRVNLGPGQHLRHPINEGLGILSPPLEDAPDGATFPYLLAICDWCGTREFINDPHADKPLDQAASDARNTLYSMLGWKCRLPTTGQPFASGGVFDFCTAKCNHDHRRSTL